MDPERTVQIAYKILNDFQGSIVAVITLVLTYPILKKKLLENHISKSLVDIQETNKELIRASTDLIDAFVPHTYTNERISREELEYLYSKIGELSLISQQANQDSHTMIFFLKETLRNTLRHYDPHTHGIIYSREILGIVIEVLNEVIFFSTQVVQIPKSSKTIKGNLINKKIRKNVTHSEFEKYKYFKQGIIGDPRSAHALLFYKNICSTSTKLIARSAFQVFESVHPISNMLVIREFYAPLTLEMENFSPLSSGNHVLYLMGFRIRTSLGVDPPEAKTVIELSYTNPSDFYGFVKSMTKEKFLKFFNDTYLPDSRFDLSRMTGFSSENNEIISLKFDFEYVNKQFKLNRKKLKRKMNSERSLFHRIFYRVSLALDRWKMKSVVNRQMF